MIALGTSMGEFDALPEHEQEYWIAYQMHRMEELGYLLTTLKEAKYPDAGALVATLLNSI